MIYTNKITKHWPLGTVITPQFNLTPTTEKKKNNNNFFGMTNYVSDTPKKSSQSG